MTQHTCLDTTGILTPTQSHKKPGFCSGCFAEEGGWGETNYFAPSSSDAMPHHGSMFQLGSEGLIFMKSG